MEKAIDLRSDTVTKPTAAMLEAMFTAKVGDDVFEEDPTIIELENKAAALFGMEAGLFCPSGTMTNQIAIRLFTQPQSEVICDRLSHIYNYEGGGIAYNSLSSVRLLHGNRGVFTAKEVVENIQPDNIHFPETTLVAIENTVNKGGGSYYTLKEIAEIREVCVENKIALHLDGARIFNALEETKEAALNYGKYFNSISICLSKGLGAPVGSVLLLPKSLLGKAKRIRKVLGGGMRQAGFLAAAGIYALDNHVKRLKEDHIRAKEIEKVLLEIPFISSVLPVSTNIIIFDIPDEDKMSMFMSRLEENNIKAGHFSKKAVRMVTHLDFDDEMLEKLIKVLRSIKINS